MMTRLSTPRPGLGEGFRVPVAGGSRIVAALLATALLVAGCAGVTATPVSIPPDAFIQVLKNN